MKTVLFAIVISITSAFSVNAWAERVTAIDLVRAQGSGCAPGEASVTLAEDGTGFSVSLREYRAQMGSDIAEAELRKTCDLSVRVSVPDGFTYGIAAIETRGY